MQIVALETSHQPGQVALLRGDTVIYEAALPVEQRTTESFAVALVAAFAAADWRPADVEQFAVSEGPGSFTGLRIGVTAAKTFAYATGASVIAINTLDVLAAQACEWRQVAHAVDTAACRSIWATIDAQRKQLFVARYELAAPERNEPAAAASTATRVSEIEIVEADDWLQQRAEQTTDLVTGSGLIKVATKNRLPAGLKCSDQTCWTATARMLARIAAARQGQSPAHDLWSLVPKYYRKSAAEEKRSG